MDKGQKKFIHIPQKSLKLSREYFSIPFKTRNVKTYSKEIPEKHTKLYKSTVVFTILLQIIMRNFRSPKRPAAEIRSHFGEPTPWTRLHLSGVMCAKFYSLQRCQEQPKFAPRSAATRLTESQICRHQTTVDRIYQNTVHL